MGFVYKLYGNLNAICNGHVIGCCQTELGSSYLLWLYFIPPIHSSVHWKEDTIKCNDGYLKLTKTQSWSHNLKITKGIVKLMAHVCLCIHHVYTPVHLVESVENYALCMRRCLLCSSNMSVTTAHLLLCARIVLKTAPSIKFCAIASYCLFHSRAQVVSFTDSMMWTGVQWSAHTHTPVWSIQFFAGGQNER